MTITVDWCGHDAAKYACEHWHYSKSMPAAGATSVGAWEDGLFIGAVVFGKGANKSIGGPYGLKQTEVCELVRVALRGHSASVTQIISLAIKKLKRHCPGLRLIVSYADTGQGHLGIIYQAGNWVYTGVCKDAPGPIVIHGVAKHARSVISAYGTSRIDYIKDKIDPRAVQLEFTPKHKYLYPLDKKMRKQVAELKKPYPKTTNAEAA